MRGWVVAALLGGVLSGQGLPRDAAERFAALALKCAGQEYPNKLDHVMNGPGDVLGPRVLHPAFYGCFDWHSAVHGHWLMVRALRAHPDLARAVDLRRVLDAHLAPGPIAAELAYLGQPSRASFERTYGWAWLLKLAAELKTWDDPDARRWEAALRPLAEAFAERTKAFLPKQTYPIRTGVHPNSAYSLSLALDYAEAYGDAALAALIREKAMGWFARDRRAPLVWEPGGEDFLSPSLEEAALMARLMPARTFRPWLRSFLPDLVQGGPLAPAVVSDRTDPKIVHLDGLNLSRARCLHRLASALDPKDPARTHFRRLAEAHAQASLPHIASGSYEGEHWLGTFAVHLLEAQAADRGR
ncbi:MAG: hypothetical protein BWY56_02332 [Acidobacteria bacterium ADurb.Bin340]|nr:MAG: hypothetical protein BWY56_02332 [Acidobacteria bacterium ADurb.Bin340]HQL47170.1 DUF2891 domain-containing protein [Holophaga sp.]